MKFSNDKIVYRQIKDEIDEFFYYNDRENWQPNIDLSEKSNKNTENVVTDDLFDDKMGKKFISFETYDGKVDNNENLVEENSREEKICTVKIEMKIILRKWIKVIFLQAIQKIR